MAEKGRRVAEKLQEIENMLSEVTAEPKPKNTDRFLDRTEKIKEELEALERKNVEASKAETDTNKRFI